MAKPDPKLFLLAGLGLAFLAKAKRQPLWEPAFPFGYDIGPRTSLTLLPGEHSVPVGERLYLDQPDEEQPKPRLAEVEFERLDDELLFGDISPTLGGPPNSDHVGFDIQRPLKLKVTAKNTAGDVFVWTLTAT